MRAKQIFIFQGVMALCERCGKFKRNVTLKSRILREKKRVKILV